jgi:hypothetical protein
MGASGRLCAPVIGVLHAVRLHRRHRLVAAALGILASLGSCVSTGSHPDSSSGSYMEVDHQVQPEDAPPEPVLVVRALDLRGVVLPGAVVELADGQRRFAMRTGPEGSVEPVVSPGVWRIAVSVAGFTPVSMRVTIRRSERCVVEAYLRMIPEYQLTVALEDLD